MADAGACDLGVHDLDTLDRLRAVLLVPMLLGGVLMVITMPQVAALNHEVAVQVIIGSLPLAALQVYLAPRDNARSAYGGLALADTHLLGLCFFYAVGCAAHCASIRSFWGIVNMVFLCTCIVALRPLLWASQRHRAARLRDKSVGSPAEVEDALHAVGKVGAAIFFMYYNIFESMGCIGLKYKAPRECVDAQFANLVVVTEVALVCAVEFAVVQSGLVTYHQLITLQLGRNQAIIALLLLLTVLATVFVFASRGAVTFYEIDEKTQAADGFNDTARLFVSSYLLTWLAIVVLCRNVVSRAKGAAVRVLPDDV